MSSSGIAETRQPSPAGRLVWPIGAWLAGAFLLANLVLRGHALHAAGAASWPPRLALAGLAIGTVLALMRPAVIVPALPLFGASFFLYGFHSYRPQSQVFELLVAAFALPLLARSLRRGGGSRQPALPRVFLLFGAYALLATFSLLLLPAGVLEHRLFLEAADFPRALLGAFPKDPLYPIAAVNRLWLLMLFAGLLAAQDDGRELYRRLFRGVAWAAITAAALGLADFAGWLSLDRYNLSNLFYGSRYRRLQSTFGNPSWFACFVACALPFVLLEFHRTRGRARLALAAAPPVIAAALFLSGARASWLAVAALMLFLAAAGVAAHRRGLALPPADAAVRLSLGATLVAGAWLAVTAATTPNGAVPEGGGPPGRLEGLSRELQYRGLGLDSPRRVAGQYAVELARLAPLLGLGYETFNLHLRAQLEIPGTGVSRVVSTARAFDPGDALFDDSHNSYLQALAGTGLVGLGLWLALLAAGIGAALRSARRQPNGETLAALTGLLLFHFYGLFQGMAYIPVTFSLYPLLLGYVATLDVAAVRGPRLRVWLLATVSLLAAGMGYLADNGFASLKRRFGVSAYLPDEAAVYEGFYRPEQGPGGEFRWMRQRAIVNIPRAAPFRLRFTCEHPDVEREPVLLTLRFEGRELTPIVFHRPGVVEQRFDLETPGALRLSASRTFRPSGPDRRELGVAVSAIRWE